MNKQYELIQAIRGIAAVLVVYLHTAHQPAFGSFGVDIFFVLSGAMMAMLMQQGPSGAVFLTRRLMRIVPLYFLATTAAYLVSVFYPAGRTSGNLPTFSDYLKSIAFIPHEVSSGGIAPVLSVGWTLNHEMVFYFCCAVACFLSTRQRAMIASAAVALWIAMFSSFFPETAPGRFYANPIVVEFVAGMLVWNICRKLDINLKNPTFLCGGVVLIAAMAWSECAGFSPFGDLGPWGRPARYVLPAMLLVSLGFMANHAFELMNSRTRQLMVLLGDSSYAIYLTHIFALGLSSLMLAKVGLPPASSGVGCALTCLAAITGGIAVYIWIELPFQKWIKGRVSC